MPNVRSKVDIHTLFELISSHGSNVENISSEKILEIIEELLVVAKTRMQDIVVILPGITGSVLQKDGKDIWAFSGQAAWQGLKTLGESLQQLRIEQDDPEAEDLGDGIKATRLAADAHLVPGLVKIDGYTSLTRLITDNFQVIPGNIREDKPANLFEFPYDWRRDNRASARLLKKNLDERLHQWQEYTGNQDAKVILLAHSMGGLVSRYYLEVLEGWRDCKALFTFGTPHRGSVNAVNFVANSYKKLFMDLTEVLRSLPSIYQLMPIYKVVKIGEEYHRIAEVDNLPNVVRTRAENALAFHREIEAAVNGNQNNADYLKSYKIIPIVGTQQPTMQSVLLEDGQLTTDSALPRGIDPELASGDGSVPHLSAIPIELSQEYRETYIAERHGSLQNNPRVLEELRNRLITTQAQSLRSIRDGVPEVSPLAAKRAAISLALDDLYLADEPVRLSARVLNGDKKLSALKAEITSVSGKGRAINVEFQQQGEDWELLLDDLAAGLYRVRVHTGEIQVQDLFEVVK